MDEAEALLVLNAVKGIGNSKIRKLLDYYGSAKNILALTETDLMGDRIVSEPLIKNIVAFPKEHFLRTEYGQMEKGNVHVVTYLDDEYPGQLREIADAPIIFYVRGQIPPDHSLSMALVGSRSASLYGLSTAEKFAIRLADLGFTIVSGMARGIDTAAHYGALKARGQTVAVLGCGLCRVYPPENHELFNRIAEAGAVLSEFPMATPPLANNFPRRNRIISGLSLGVIVVEAAQRSGALITADFALEQGREVFAVPGNINSGTSQGVHYLIQQGAKLVTCIEDVLDDIVPHCSGYLNNSIKRAGEHSWHKQRSPLSDHEQAVYGQIKDRPVHIDELTDKCGPAVPVMAVLLQLELKKMIKQLPGKLFIHERKGRGG